MNTISPEDILDATQKLRWKIPLNFHDHFIEAIYKKSADIAERNVSRQEESRRLSLERKLDWLLTSKWTGFPMMLIILAIVLWLTIVGANYPSAWTSQFLIDFGYHALSQWANSIGMWWWLKGILVDGVYLTTAWVISVMLFPMAIFFPLFTMLEDLGYLPRIAFNVDRLFQKVGAHGKQALTIAMGMGCNAAGVIATRIIDSPRERLIAIITNNFSLCNGRWPTQILIATIFIGAVAPAAWSSAIAVGAVIGITLLGFALTLAISWLLAKTILKGEASFFSLELPPYRPPRVLHTLYTSLIDRTIFVLWRAVVFAMPAGAVIWLISNIHIEGVTIAQHLIQTLQPLGWLMGLNGIILLAYIVAIPANEIVLPTILMLTVLTTGITGVGEHGAGVLFSPENNMLRDLLIQGRWTTLTAICLMIFSLSHNPCSTTVYTIYKETRSKKWTLLATFLPVFIGFFLCATIALVWRMV